MGESVDIVVSQTGADEAAAGFAALSTAADQAATSVDTTNQSINFLKEASAAAATPVQAMADAVSSTRQPIESFNNAAGYSDTVLRAIQSAAARANITMEEYAKRMEEGAVYTNKASDAIEHATTATQNHSSATEHHTEATKSLSEASTILTQVMGALGLLFTADKIIELTEAYQKTEIQMRSISATAKDLEHNTAALYDISQKTGSSFAANVESFQKLSIETRGLGIEQKDLLSVVRDVDALIQQSGGTAAQSAQAVSLFGRALATGEVSGRQFRTLLLQFPQLGQLVAAGMNTSVSALVTTSQKSAVASKDFTEAFLKAADAAGVASHTIELTLAQAITSLGNSMLVYVGQTEHANGITQLLSRTIAGIANNFAFFATIIEVGITLWASYYTTLVVIPGVIALITNAIRTLTLAVAANPLGFLIVTLTSLIALVYEFGNSIKLTSDGSITVLGAFIGVWNVLRNVITNVWALVSGPLTTAFSFLGNIIAAPFRLALAVVQSFLDLLSQLIPSLGGISVAFDAMLAPITKFKETMVDAMTEATSKLNETGDATKNLAQLLGGDDPRQNLNGAAKAATASTKGLSDNLTQMGRVNAAAIPPFNNLTSAIDKSGEAMINGLNNARRYSAEAGALADKLIALSLTTRNAMGEMVKATDEWARRSGADFNAVAKGTTSAAEAMNKAAGGDSSSITSGGGSTSSTPLTGSRAFNLDPNGQHTNPMLEGGTSTDGGRTFQLPGENLRNYQLYGYPAGQNPWGAVAWNDLLSQTQDTTLQAKIKADAHQRGIPGFANGGAFEVSGGGGTDSQLVQFMATPGERVTVQTPRQQAGSQGGGQRPVVINMNITTADANSFRRSKNQIYLELQSKLNNVGAVL